MHTMGFFFKAFILFYFMFLDLESLSVVLLEVSPTDWWQKPVPFVIDELICSRLKHFLNDIWSFPIWGELRPHMSTDDRSLQY
jgi:hypothetical protein